VCLLYEPALGAEDLTATSSEPKWMTSNNSHQLTRRIVIPSEARDLLFGCVQAGLVQLATYS
jgi:hypothetical protein